MFKNSAATAFASKKIASSKWLLLLCAASAAVVDIIIIAMLLVGEEGGEYLACPFLLLIFDVFYFVVSLVFTNFRFKYSIAVWVSYILLYTLGLIIGISIILGGSGTVLSNAAITLWSCVHLFNIICAVVCALFASHVINKLWIALAFAVVFLAGAATYAGFVISDGFFGQGRDSRTLVYSYNGKTGQYSVTDVLAGRSSSVTVPETFNGKPVTKVSLKVFAAIGVKNYSLPENVEFTNDSTLNRRMDKELSEIRITVGKDSVNDVRSKLWRIARAYDGNIRENAIALANATLPVNLAENEGYVAFNYPTDGFTAVQGKTIPVYVGDLNKFDFAEYSKGYDYVTYREDSSADNYYWALNHGGYILSDIETGGDIFNGVSGNTVASMKFEKVYCMRVDDGNDSMYPMREKQPDFCYDTVGGMSEYKYLTLPKARTYLNDLTPRNGFTNRWLYYITSPTMDGSYFTNLADMLKKTDGQIPTVSTRWELDIPEVTVKTSAPDNTITYGDNVILTSEVKHRAQADGLKISYRWTLKDETYVRWTTQNVELTHPERSTYEGTYTLVVVAGGGELTSLGAVKTVKVDLKINRKQIALNWDVPQNAVYDGTLKTYSVSHDTSLDVEDDPVRYFISGLTSYKNAGTYDLSVTVDPFTLLNYDVLNTKNSLTIAPCPVEVDWDNYEGLMYNGLLQSPTATAVGVNSDGALPVAVSGATKNAGTHTATATTSNKNYAITNPTRTFIIDKKPLTITANNVAVAYGKTEPQKVTVSESQCQGFVEGDGVSSLTGTAWQEYEGKDFGVHEGGVKLWGLSSDNYDIEYVYGQLTVGRRAIQLEWINTDNLVYDGESKNVTAVVINKGYEDDDIRVIVTGGNAFNAGTYTATAEIDPDCAAADNYSFTFAPADNRKCTYTIQKRTVTADWYVTQDGAAVSKYVYNGKPYSVGMRVFGAVDTHYGWQLFSFEGEIKPINAGTYTYKFVIDEHIAGNYEIKNGEFEFTIARAQSEITISTISLENVTASAILVRRGDDLSWQSNIPAENIEVYYSYDDDTAMIHYVEGDSFTFTEEGDYEFTFHIEETSNYSGKTVKLTVYYYNLEHMPEVVK